MSQLKFHVLTLFPEIFSDFLKSSLIGKALEKKLISVSLIQIRDFARDKHRTVDDSPYGGGDGMLLKADVLYEAWKSARAQCGDQVKTLLLSPQGQHLTQLKAKEWADGPREFILVCGHYEGVDERFIEKCVDEEVSIGDYVLTGGELPAMILIDVFARLVPGVVGKQGSVSGDSLEGGLLKYPQYTRPQVFEGLEVPKVLMGGNHIEIEKWRKEQSLSRTRSKRPDLVHTKK